MKVGLWWCPTSPINRLRWTLLAAWPKTILSLLSSFPTEPKFCEGISLSYSRLKVIRPHPQPQTDRGYSKSIRWFYSLCQWLVQAWDPILPSEKWGEVSQGHLGGFPFILWMSPWWIYFTGTLAAILHQSEDNERAEEELGLWQPLFEVPLPLHFLFYQR